VFERLSCSDTILRRRMVVKMSPLQIIADGRRSGELRDDIDPRLLDIAIIGLCEFIVCAARPGPILRGAERVLRHCEFQGDATRPYASRPARAVRVDPLGGQRIDGHIDSFHRGAGANFALLQPDNAIGNFVKVVQRIPVKIVLDGPAEALSRIAPGMSVEADVSIRPAPAWPAPFL
jgi:hypothetical protein